LPEHHVYLDDKGFFERMKWNNKVKLDKEGKAEAYSKLIHRDFFNIFLKIEIVKEVLDEEMTKFKDWELYEY
jgi:hypothetical protein